MATLRKIEVFDLYKELNDNSSSSLVIGKQGEASSYVIDYSITKAVSGVVNTGKLVVNDIGELLRHGYQFCDQITGFEINSSVVGTDIQLDFVLNSVGENLIFKGKLKEI